MSSLDLNQNRGCKKKDEDHMEFLCELYEAQAACCRYSVHELTSEVNSRTKCAAKDHGRARKENNSGGPVHAWVGCM